VLQTWLLLTQQSASSKGKHTSANSAAKELLALRISLLCTAAGTYRSPLVQQQHSKAISSCLLAAHMPALLYFMLHTAANMLRIAANLRSY
jgi:hypothetical protein